MEHSALFWLFNGAVVISVSALTIYCARIRKGSGKYLCEDCRFNDPTSCLKAERPKALICTSYRQGAAIAEASIAEAKTAEARIGEAKITEGKVTEARIGEAKITEAKSTNVVETGTAQVAAERAAAPTGTSELDADEVEAEADNT